MPIYSLRFRDYHAAEAKALLISTTSQQLNKRRNRFKKWVKSFRRYSLRFGLPITCTPGSNMCWKNHLSCRRSPGPRFDRVQIPVSAFLPAFLGGGVGSEDAEEELKKLSPTGDKGLFCL